MRRLAYVFGALLLLTATALPALGQDAGSEGPPVGVWQKEFAIGLNILQSSYSQNWNGGDKGSVVWNGTFDGRMEKQYSERSNWRNTLKLAYGQTHSQERDTDGSLYWQKPDKTDDLVAFESLYRVTPKSGWDPFVALSFESMFDDRNDPENRSLPFNPLILSPSVGIARTLVAAEHRSLLARVGVAWVLNSRRFFTDPAPSTATIRESSNEIAAEAVIEYKVGALDKRVDWESRLTLMLPFVYSAKSVFEDDFDPTDFGLPADVASYTTTLDVDWENTFTANITKVISVKLYVRWVYDKYDNTVAPIYQDGDLVNAGGVLQALRKAGQFKETLALGLGYRF
jgi:hypothetical protein